MVWEPEKFTREQRCAAGSAITQARIVVYRLRRDSAASRDAVGPVAVNAYRRVEDMLAMLYDDLYGLEGSGGAVRIPQPPSAS